MRTETCKRLVIVLIVMVSLMTFARGRLDCLMSPVSILAGIVALNMPAEFLRGYDDIKNNPGELRRFGCLKSIVGYALIVGGTLFVLADLLAR